MLYCTKCHHYVHMFENFMFLFSLLCCLICYIFELASNCLCYAKQMHWTEYKNHLRVRSPMSSVCGQDCDVIYGSIFTKFET